MKILYIAYAASPYGGSEEALGWNLPLAMSQIEGNEVHLITKVEQQDAVRDYLGKHPETKLTVSFCDIPSFYKKVFKGYLYPGRHSIWLKRVTPMVRVLDASRHFDVIHQIAPVEFRSLGRFAHTKALTVAGPQGGAEYAPKSLAKYLRPVAPFELMRKISNWLIVHSPGFRKSYRDFDIHLFANYETQRYLVKHGLEEAVNAIVKTEVGCWSNAWHDHERNSRKIPHILYAGRLIPRKGVELLIDACTELKGVCDFELRIVGEGHLHESLARKIAERGLSNVTLVGGIDHAEMSRQYAWADFFVMPSIRETGGAVLAESMQNGLPLITFNQDGACVALNDTVCQYVPVFSGAHGFAEAMRKWIDCPKSMPSTDAVKQIFSSLTWEKRASYYLVLYSRYLAIRANKNANCNRLLHK